MLGSFDYRFHIFFGDEVDPNDDDQDESSHHSHYHHHRNQVTTASRHSRSLSDLSVTAGMTVRIPPKSDADSVSQMIANKNAHELPSSRSFASSSMS